VQKAQEVFSISERRVCRALGQPRSTQRYQGRKRRDEELLEEQVVALASQYGRYGYRRITALLKMTGWHVNHKRVERISRRTHLPRPQVLGRDDVAAGWADVCPAGVKYPLNSPSAADYG